MEINVGKIVNTHGVKGEVKILTASDFASERFKPGKVLMIPFKEEKVILTIKSYRTHKNFHMVSFEGLNNINDVEKYKGLDVFQDIENKDIILDEHEYFYSDIIGCTVYDGAREIGTVKEIFETGANDVWVVQGEKEYLIPYIEDVVKSIDIDHKKIIIEPIEGLLE
ncbi:ribosome maturation factor RimM [Macrococcus armenti]|uniref:ribosome maturation factor RimM n=1 Tax=Macrococcus armenti TaxID=2875764 RepID=UPI001CCB7A73|nr:ribosome maturation factor RimM [Macrococcus armenti]UBH09534.1 ribosome maturation factor RimM [Macrococcus armenti]UBH11811.1 ribosome maturation factor RimM [Macrococcus armenti]UBH16287.1 ribosome maturation factor RimM [Macrococcus armenti]UBH18645.1 ribosome maturation factor RimM [Macrococcus armenti]UBH20915.1 ribosome maturation factor RimM [Macrococcus armenti]